MASETLEMRVHNHGPEDGQGLACRESLVGDCIRAEYARIARELEEAREIIRDLVDDEDAGLVWLGRRLVCAYCTADGLYSVAHAADCPINRARHALAALRPEAQGEAEPLAWRVEYRRRGDGDARWYHLSTYTNERDARERAKHAEGPMRVLECRIIPLYASPAAALRSDAQGQDRWEDVVFGPITEAYNEAHAARRSEGGGK